MTIELLIDPKWDDNRWLSNIDESQRESGSSFDCWNCYHPWRYNEHKQMEKLILFL